MLWLMFFRDCCCCLWHLFGLPEWCFHLVFLVYVGAVVLVLFFSVWLFVFGVVWCGCIFCVLFGVLLVLVVLLMRLLLVLVLL